MESVTSHSANVISRWTRTPRIAIVALLIASGTAHSATGASLYERHCGRCHGHRGAGGLGVPLALIDLLAVSDQEYLRRTIRLGRPGRNMPAFRTLTNAEVLAIARYVRGWLPMGARRTRVRVGRGDPVRGGFLYDQYCNACHGPRGEGGAGTGITYWLGRYRSVLPPALNNTGFLASASDAMIKATLVRGRRGTPMPSFAVEGGLTDAEMDDVVAYVRAFQSDPLPDALRYLQTRASKARVHKRGPRLVAHLAGPAALGGGIGAQTREGDPDAAVDAQAVAALLHPFERGDDVAQIACGLRQLGNRELARDVEHRGLGAIGDPHVGALVRARIARPLPAQCRFQFVAAFEQQPHQ